MIKRSQRSAILALARPVVEALAPDELPMLEATADAYLSGTSRDDEELLGFGLDDTIIVVSVAALSAARAVVTFLGSIFVDAVREESSDAVRVWIGRTVNRWRGDRSDSAAAEAAEAADELLAAAEQLSQKQLQRVWKIAYNNALGAGMAAESAALVADAIVSRLSEAPNS